MSLLRRRSVTSATLAMLTVLLSTPQTDPLAAEPAGVAAIQLSLPLDYQVHQRATRTEGRIRVEGTVPASAAGTATVEVRLVGVGVTEAWQQLAGLTPGQASFGADFTAPSGGWYRLEARVKRQNAVVAQVVVEHVGVGEVFVMAGQSNAANHGEEKQQTKTGLVSSFSGTQWSPAHDPQPGASGSGGSFVPPFGDAVAARFKVPVGVVATGVGATSVREWLPHGARFANPPTLTGNVRVLLSGEWESKGSLFETFVKRTRQLGPQGFRAVLWHQGESDANQQDASRTLPGELYAKYLEQLIRETRREIGWESPWFVAQASYHTPDDTGSPDIRAAQQALWKSGAALEGPDTDALTGGFRDSGGKGVHFSASGLREHAQRWMDKVAPWLDRQLALAPTATSAKSKPANAGPHNRLALPGENFTVEGRPAFVFLPPAGKRANPQPWILYAPTLPPYPDEAERWMHEQFLAAGIAVAGVDVGEAYGSPKSHAFFDALHRELTERRGFAAKPCLFGRSRGGLWVSSWAIANPARVAGLIGIYPVFDFRTYPGITNAAPAYGMTPAELDSRAAELNPVARLGVLANAHVPAALIHGDIDKVVPLKENSAEFVRRYREAGVESLVKLIVLEGQGHSYFEGFFHSRELVDFAIARARAGALP